VKLKGKNAGVLRTITKQRGECRRGNKRSVTKKQVREGKSGQLTPGTITNKTRRGSAREEKAAGFA